MPANAKAHFFGMNLDIRNASCQPTGPDLNTSKKYRLIFGVEQPAHYQGLKKSKSDYVRFNGSDIFWRRPFGSSFTLVCATSEARIAVTLRQRHTLRQGQDMGTCSIDCSTLIGSHMIESPVFSGGGAQIGLLKLTVTLSVVETEAAAQQAMDANAQMVSAPIDPTVELPSGLSDVADTAKRLDLGSVLARLDGFMKVADLAAEVHPLVKLAWGVVSVAYEVVKLQTERDSLVQQLIGEMDESCKAAQDATPLRDQSQRSGEIVVKILIQVIQCSYFVKEYCSEPSFGVRLLRDTASLVDQQANDYIDTLQKLRRGLNDHPSISAAATIYRVFGKIEAIEDHQLLSEVKFADKAYDDDPWKRCLDGTRTEIIEAILQWATHAVSPDTKDRISRVPKLSTRVLWLCGVAGSGKSRIARSVAARLHKLQRLGSLYCCDYKNRETLNTRSLFSTIALHLADRDPLRKQRLVAAIRDDGAIRRTEICRQQYQHFIVTPSADLPVVGDTVIIIDAFDEIGSAQDREDALEILTKRAHELPGGLRIVVTSRFERDIRDALQLPDAAGAEYMLMEDIPTDLTVRDTAVYVQDALKGVKGLTSAQLAELAMAAGDSFLWASTACRYIRDGNDEQGVQLPRERLPLFLGGNRGLDELYARILNEHFGEGSPDHLARLKLILGQIVAAKEPQSLRALWELTPQNLPAPKSHLSLDDYQDIVRHLASLLVNTHDVDQPIYPFHTSFLHFLCNAEQQHEYVVDVEQANYYLAIGCLEVMRRELRFNICQIPTSYKANKDIENLDTLITENISPHLRYASNFWAQHISHLTDVGDMISSKLLGLLRSSHFLQWLEVMSVTGRSFQAPLITLDSPSIARASGNLVSVIRDLKQFTSVFATPIHQSAPHIYLSALAFVPTCSVLYILYQHFLKMVILRQGRMVDWPRLVHVYTGHTGGVGAVAVSPDGDLVVSASNDCTIRIWSTATGAPIGEALQGHTSTVAAVSFSPDGMHLVSGSWDNTVRLWSAKSFVAIGEALSGHASYVRSVMFSPDGTRVVSGSRDRTIRMWDISTGSQIGAPLLGHEDDVNAVVFSPDGEILISGSSDSTIRIWNATTGAVIREPLRGHSGAVYCVAFSPDGTRFASASDDNTIQLWDSRTFIVLGKPLRGHFGYVMSLAFSPDGTLVASGSGDETIRVWDATTGAAIGEPLRGHTYVVSSLAFLPDGSHLVSGSFDKTIRLWNTTSGAEPLRHRHTNWVTSVAFSGDGKYIASCSYDETEVWDTALGIAVGEPLRGHDGWVNSVAFSPDGTLIASSSNDRTIRLWKAITGELFKELAGHSDAVQSVVFAPDGTQIISGSFDKTIRLWNVATGEEVGEPLRGHRHSITSVAVSPDGTFIASGSFDQTVRIWNLGTGAMIGTPLEGHYARVNSVAISPNGTKIASGSDDSTIRLWSAKSQAPIGKPLQGHSSDVMSVAFSYSGAFIVSGFAAGIIQLWNVETGAKVGESLSDHTNTVTSVACSPDGVHIASGSLDKSVRLWNIGDILAGDATGQAHGDSAKSEALSFGGTVIEVPSTSGAILHCRSVATQYPPHLFPNQTFKIRNGWILGPDDELLLWVPPANRSDLMTPSSTSRIMGVAHPTELDFSNFKCGMEWMQCHEHIE